jgi:hypothetical protein
MGLSLPAQIGSEIAVPVHLQDGQEFAAPLKQLLSFGKSLFTANWTIEEGGGRPLTKGTGNPLSDSSSPLLFPRNFNRISAPEMNSCAGCHNKPIVGGGGEFGTLVFVLGQRFDFSTFDHSDPIPTRGARDEAGNFVVEQNIANGRKTVAMSGSGFIEALAHEITADLRAIRDTIPPGGSAGIKRDFLWRSQPECERRLDHFGRNRSSSPSSRKLRSGQSAHAHPSAFPSSRECDLDSPVHQQRVQPASRHSIHGALWD